MERLDPTNLIITALSATAAGIGWLVRSVLTDRKRIELLEADSTRRAEQRQEDREAVREVREDVKAILHELSRAAK